MGERRLRSCLEVSVGPGSACVPQAAFGVSPKTSLSGASSETLNAAHGDRKNLARLKHLSRSLQTCAGFGKVSEIGDFCPKEERAREEARGGSRGAATLRGMSLKIKWNDDRVKGAATAVVLITRFRLAQGHWGGLIQASLVEYREDYEGYKARHPTRTLAAAKDSSGLVNAQRREFYEKLVAAVETLLARVERNRTRFSSLIELDNYLASQLKSFE